MALRLPSRATCRSPGADPVTVRLVFLGRLADLAGVAEREVAGPLDWPGLLASLGPELAQAVQGEKVRIAQDGTVLADKTALVATGGEIALLPPVSGG